MRTLAVLLLALLGAAIWWTAVPDGADVAPVAADGAAVTAPGTAAAPPVVEGRVTAPDAAPAGATADEDKDDDVHVLAVDADTDAPVVGVAVHWTFPAPGANDDPDVLAERARLARLVRHTGRDGRARVPRPPPSAWLEGRLGERWGSVHWNVHVTTSPESPLRLVLERDHTLRVLVVDGSGVPVPGIDVVRRVARTEGGMPPTRLGTTGHDGLVVCEHAQRLGRRLLGTPVDRCAIAVDVLGVHVEREVDVREPPREPLRLVVPPLGWLAVTARDQADRLVQDTLYLRVTASDGATAPARPRRELRPGDEHVVIPVAAGLRLHVEGSVQGVSLAPQEVPGPATHGARVEAVLRPFADQPLLTGRLVDRRGAPLPNQAFRVLLDGEEAGQLRATTGGEGRFGVLLRREWAGRTLRLVEVRVGDHGRSSPLACRHAVDRTLRGGANEVGDVVLTEAPLLVGGVLVDAAGRAVPRATLYVQLAHDADPAWRRNGGFRIVPVVYCHLDQDGRFVVRGFTEAQDLVLLVDAGGFVPAGPLPFRVGTPDLRVELQATVAFAARVRHGLEDARGLLALRAQLRPEGEPLPPMYANPSAGGAGELWFRQELPPGRYAFELFLQGDDAPFHTVANVELRAGAPCNDPRLDPIDVHALLRELHVTIADGEGRTIADRGGTLTLPQGKGVAARIPFEGGVATVPFAGVPRHVVVEVPGFRRTEVRDLDADAIVTLLPSAAVRLEPEWTLPLGVRARVFLRGPSFAVPSHPFLVNSRDPTFGAGVEATPVDGGSAFTFTAAEAGTHQVRVLLSSVASGKSVVLDGVQPAALTLDPAAAGRHTLRVDAATLATALHQLR